MIVPLILAGVALYGCFRRVDVYTALVQGAGDGLEVLMRILPSLVGLLTAVYMLRASGALDLAAQALTPLLDRIGPAGRAASPDAGAAHQRLGGTGGGGGADRRPRAGLLPGPDRGGDAGVHGDHVLHHCRLLRRGEDHQDPVRCPGGALRGFDGFSGRSLGGPAVLWNKSINFAKKFRKNPMPKNLVKFSGPSYNAIEKQERVERDEHYRHFWDECIQ